MSGLDGLQLDADGYLDMDQFPDDGTDLAGPELDQLRDALRADPVEEPTAEEWDAMFDEVLAAEDTGPFAVDDVDGDLATDTETDTEDLFATDTEADGEDPFTAEAEADDPLDTTDDGLPDTDDLDIDVDLDGGLDLGADDTGDDAFSAAALADEPADIAGNDFEDLL